MEATATAVPGADGKPLYRLVVVRDVTELHRARESLERQADELRKHARLFDLAHDAILVRDLATSRILFWNRGAELLYGWAKEEALGRVSHELFRTDFPRPLAEIEAVLRRAGPWEGELAHTGRDGKRCWVASRWALHSEQRGDGAAVMEINSDITERKRLQEEEAQVARYLGLLVESAGEGIYGIDLQGRCTFINRAAVETLRYRPDELLGQNMHGLIHHTRIDGSPYPEEECPIYRAFRERKGVRQDDEVLWRRDATAFPAEYSSYPVFDGEELKGAVVTFRDLTDKKRSGSEPAPASPTLPPPAPA